MNFESGLCKVRYVVHCFISYLISLVYHIFKSVLNDNACKKNIFLIISPGRQDLDLMHVSKDRTDSISGRACNLLELCVTCRMCQVKM